MFTSCILLPSSILFNELIKALFNELLLHYVQELFPPGFYTDEYLCAAQEKFDKVKFAKRIIKQLDAVRALIKKFLRSIISSFALKFVKIYYPLIKILIKILISKF